MLTSDECNMGNPAPRLPRLENAYLSGPTAALALLKEQLQQRCTHILKVVAQVIQIIGGDHCFKHEVVIGLIEHVAAIVVQ